MNSPKIILLNVLPDCFTVNPGISAYFTLTDILVEQGDHC